MFVVVQQSGVFSLVQQFPELSTQPEQCEQLVPVHVPTPFGLLLDVQHDDESFSELQHVLPVAPDKYAFALPLYFLQQGKLELSALQHVCEPP